MAVYKYVALDANNKVVKGQVEADSEYRAVIAASETGLRVTEVRGEGQGPVSFTGRHRLDWTDLTTFAEHLQAALAAGVPLPSSVDVLARSLRTSRLKALVDDVRPRIERGETLSDALSALRGSFPPVFLSMIRAGEQTGKLPEVLDQLARYSRQMAETRLALREVMAYPLFLGLFVIGLLGFLGGYVVPSFAEIYTSFDTGPAVPTQNFRLTSYAGYQTPGATITLPLPTRIILAFSTFVRSYGWELIVALGAAVVLFWLCIKLAKAAMGPGNSFDLWWDGVKLRVPLFGRLYQQALTARFCETFSAFLQTRVDLPEGLVLAGASSGSPVLADVTVRAALLVSHGETMATSLGKAKFFDPSFLWMLDRGEAQGHPVEALNRLAQSSQRELERRRQWIMTMAGPLFVSFAAILVLFMALAVFMPIVSLSGVSAL